MKSIFVILLTGIIYSVSAQSISNKGKIINSQKTIVQSLKKNVKYKVTFIELGSVRCIPCKMMQPVMKSIEANYSGIVKVEFHDVWTPEGKPFGEKYEIRAIPTQVFLDENGKEFFRHEGYFPEEEIVKVLKTKAVTD